MAVGGIAPTSDGNAVVLTDESTHRGLVLSVGGAESLAISLRLERGAASSPAGDDLLDAVVKKLGGCVSGVRVDRLEGGVFHGTVLIDRNGEVLEVEARPDDAVALALGDAVPVYVAEGVLAQAGIVVEKLDFRKLRRAPEAPRSTATGPGETEL
jgi:bifunctional DNase/RNase